MALKLRCLIYCGVALVVHDNHDEGTLLMFTATMDLLGKDFGELEVSLGAMSMHLLCSVVARA